MKHLVATEWGAVVTALVLALVAPAAPAFAAQPDGVSGPVIHHDGNWYLRTTPSSGAAVASFRYGTASDLPLVGDWNGDGTDTPGVVRNNPPTQTAGGYEVWLTRNDNSTGSADTSFTFGNDRFAPDLPLETIPRLTIEVT